ncbi:unnamed protein product, partial [Prorocentrum cordatum]
MSGPEGLEVPGKSRDGKPAVFWCPPRRASFGFCGAVGWGRLGTSSSALKVLIAEEHDAAGAWVSAAKTGLQQRVFQPRAGQGAGPGGEGAVAVAVLGLAGGRGLFRGQPARPLRALGRRGRGGLRRGHRRARACRRAAGAAAGSAPIVGGPAGGDRLAGRAAVAVGTRASGAAGALGRCRRDGTVRLRRGRRAAHGADGVRGPTSVVFPMLPGEPLAASSATCGLVVVFIAGGVTMPEVRVAHEVARDLGTEVYVGGSTILTPGSFLSTLEETGRH